MIQGFSYAFPVNLTVPVTISLVIAACGLRNGDPCFFEGYIPNYLFFESPPVYLLNDFIYRQVSAIFIKFRKKTPSFCSLFPLIRLSRMPLYVWIQHAWVWLLWLLSQTWITLHIWTPKCERLATTEKLFVTPMYNGLLIDQSLGLNRRRDDEADVKTEVSAVFRCHCTCTDHTKETKRNHCPEKIVSEGGSEGFHPRQTDISLLSQS